jgi:hypothetical protein
VLAPPGETVYGENVSKPQRVDPFVSNEPEIEVDDATSRILKQRAKTADEGRVVPAKTARQRIQKWFSDPLTLS